MKGKFMYKIYVDSRLRKETKVTLFEKRFFFWIKKDLIISDTDPAVAIAEILEKNGLSLKEISFFEAYPGPGSFTGLKMGFAAINTLKWTQNKISFDKLPLPKYGAEPNITPPKAEKVV
jgi:hypothetical protein